MQRSPIGGRRIVVFMPHIRRIAPRCGSAQGHGRGRFDPLHDKTGPAILHAGMLEQGVHHEAGIGGHVRHHQAQQEIHFTRQRRAFHDFGPGLDAGTKQVHRGSLGALGTLFQLHVDVGRQPQPHSLGFDQGDVAVDDARCFQPLVATLHRTGRKPDRGGNFVVGGAAVRLEVAKDLPIQLVKCFHLTNFALYARQAPSQRRSLQKT